MSRRALYISLFVSLALNLFIIGAVVGAVALGAQGRAIRGQMRPGQALWQAGAALTPEHRQAYRAMLRAETASVADTLRQARMSRRGAWMRFGSDPFDAPAVAQDLDRARTLEQQARGEVDRRIIEFAATLPADERARLGEALSRPARPAKR